MREYFENLSQRERYFVIAAGAALVLFLLYAMLWRPVVGNARDVQQRIAAQESELQWMRQAAAEARTLRGSARGGDAGASGGSLLSLVERTARQGRLAPAVRRVQPEGQQGVRIWLENAAFDDLLVWLHQLAATHGVGLSEIAVERQPAAGIVNGRLLLETDV